jgi:hypothetical protein
VTRIGKLRAGFSVPRETSARPLTTRSMASRVRAKLWETNSPAVRRHGASIVVDGLFFVGVHFLRKRKSSLLLGVGGDATIVASRIAERLAAPPGSN